jgi:hypothetical protein
LRFSNALLSLFIESSIAQNDAQKEKTKKQTETPKQVVAHEYNKKK